jgi:hypothetical protein
MNFMFIEKKDTDKEKQEKIASTLDVLVTPPQQGL